MASGNIGQINIALKPYSENDMMLNSVAAYGVDGKYLPPTTGDYSIYRYNSSTLANG